MVRLFWQPDHLDQYGQRGLRSIIWIITTDYHN